METLDMGKYNIHNTRNAAGDKNGKHRGENPPKVR